MFVEELGFRLKRNVLEPGNFHPLQPWELGPMLVFIGLSPFNRELLWTGTMPCSVLECLWPSKLSGML